MTDDYSLDGMRITQLRAISKLQKTLEQGVEQFRVLGLTTLFVVRKHRRPGVYVVKPLGLPGAAQCVRALFCGPLAKYQAFAYAAYANMRQMTADEAEDEFDDYYGEDDEQGEM